MKYVQQVRGKWIVRMVVPEELRGLIGQRELVEIGLPSDAKSREKKAIPIINAFLARLEEAREVYESLGEASKPTLVSAAKEHFKAELQFGNADRAAGITKHEKTTRAFVQSVYAEKLRLLVAGALDQEEAEALIGYAADALKRHGRAPNVSRKELLRTLAEIQLQAIEHFDERDSGKVHLSPPSHPLLLEPDPVPKSMPGTEKRTPSGKTLSEALAGFHRERMAGGSTLAQKTMEEHRNAVRMFNEFMGGETALRAITKNNVIDYKNALLETPNRYGMRFPGLTLPQAIKANQKLAEPFAPLAPKTINMKWLSHLSSILQWASNNGHIDMNPAQGIRVDTGSKVHKEPSYLPFTKEELKAIFGTEMFKDSAQYGLNQWALLVMLFTGVRNSSEMARMKLQYIYSEQGVMVFDLAEASKNQRSKRLVPIHDDLRVRARSCFIART